MIGVKRPLKLGTPKPPKSVKKKRLLKTVKATPDPDGATVIPNPYVEYMEQKPSELMTAGVPPFPSDVSEVTVLEEGDIPSVEDLVRNVRTEHEGLEFPNKLPYQMGERYQELRKKAQPSELIRGKAPSLSWLEERYGHLVEKSFWYDRLVKLASVFKETCEGDVFDMSNAELEKAVGHLVPYTEEEQEYLQLLANYKASSVQIDGIPTLQFLRKYHSNPPTADAADQTGSSPEYLPGFSEEEEDELEQDAMAVENRYVDTYYCPIHDDQEMQCLNPDAVCGALFFKCGMPDCAVFFTSDNHQDVCHQLRQAIHPTVFHGLYHGDLKCHCNYTPRMKLSKTQQNYGRVFLTCFKKDAPCSYFQWVHWKVRKPEGPMDTYVQKERRGPGYTQQQTRIGLDRFKKDDVRRVFPKRRWGESHAAAQTNRSFQRDYPWGPDKHRKQQGFTPSPNYRNTEFRNGLYIGNYKPSPFSPSPYFTGNQNSTACVPF